MSRTVTVVKASQLSNHRLRNRTGSEDCPARRRVKGTVKPPSRRQVRLRTVVRSQA